MPPTIKTTPGGVNYGNPFVGRVDHVAHVKVDVSALDNTQVDADGYLKPGVVLTLAGVTPADTTSVPGVVMNATKVHDNNTTLAGVTNDPFVAVGTIGQLNRDIMEDNLGRALTAAEIASLNGTGSKLALLLT